ncbi:MAG TPA: hypothetical protein DEG17_02970 [Cyanobacteria bacterium UBA11149]|nr:hypothetical protein [Cyanobacteria bacterium UBA11367]HBE57739.1 hypothetical protein [Cyanobacteria bacterium UBA11366]HBK62027.1 hypothetical protein [Cyanobacteria bacterium UBA11166]HBR76997.1 hypothetical protein [Cyanobacteria bacterium UBA11159]HBS67609.1 hypothetical protein [Cyanobacteria bacterium UBA11153]HBW87868.1 hypothetical protein [Cyanobacteria bacterium UBA11149]HCA96917.1 hypothetical protein [Cyanobacteria bacterium UBA9226]
MPVKQLDYDTSLAEYSNRDCAIALLKKYRPYLELLPSMRRASESAIAIPLPVVRIRDSKPPTGAICLPCDIAILMCDPEWKIKMGAEILIFIHRPDEDFSDLLRRWRDTQVLLDKDYEWLMPSRYEHILSEGVEKIYPLFVIFPETPQRIQRGLLGACLPFVIHTSDLVPGEVISEALYPESPTP